jgi:hypothetical protein
MLDRNHAIIILYFNGELLFHIRFIRKLFSSSHVAHLLRNMFIFITFWLKNFTRQFLSWFYLFYVVSKLNSYSVMYFLLFENLERYSESRISIFLAICTVSPFKMSKIRSERHCSSF